MIAPARLGRTPGLLLVGANAAVLTVWDIGLLLKGADGLAPAWAWAQVAVVPAAWMAVWAWATQRWALAGLGLLLTLGGLWGYLYIPPLVAVVLACVAFTRAARQRWTSAAR